MLSIVLKSISFIFSMVDILIRTYEKLDHYYIFGGMEHMRKIIAGIES